MLRRHERGQAIAETALFMPLLLLGLFGIMFAVTDGALSERLQLGVRYGGLMGTLFGPQNPYNSYSLYSMYSTLDGANPDVGCNGQGPDVSMLRTSRAPFWQPANSFWGGSANCWGYNSLVRSPGGGPYVPMQSYFMSLSAQTVAGGYVTNVLKNSGGAVNTLASQNFMHTADIGLMVSCTLVGAAAKNSLEGYGDSSTATTATPLPTTISALSYMPPSGYCSQVFGPQATSPPATPAPVPGNSANP
ncbi:MAG: hypothetical protein IAI50_10520 [Candidatus Eremiobacteraeota bacterium]|nr:hypothetical protein [Candidatus Eremiobacteraeota bacterium]